MENYERIAVWAAPLGVIWEDAQLLYHLTMNFSNGQIGL